MERFEILYKYMKREHVYLLLEKGKFRLGTLYEYRNIEKYGYIIGDDTEGKKSSSMPVRDEHWSVQDHPEFVENFFKFTNNGQLRISNLTLQAQHQSPDCFLFCTSEIFDINTMEDFGYDSCIVIHEPDRFFASISNTIITKAEFVGYSPCQYISRNLPHPQYNKTNPALIKETSYRKQKEVRAIWRPRKKSISPIVLTCPTAAQYCSFKY